MKARLRSIAFLLSYKKSIQGKVFVAFSLVLLTALTLVGFVIYYTLTNNIKTNAIDYVTDSIRRADDNLGLTLQDAGHLLSLVVTNQENVIHVLRSEHYEVSLEWFMEQKQLDSFLSYLIAYKSHINRISVVGTNGKIFFEGAPYLDRQNVNRELVGQILDSPDNKMFIKQNHNGREKTVTLGRTIKYDREAIGVVMIDLNFGVIRSNYDIRPSEDSHIYVLDADGEYVYHSNADPDTASDSEAVREPGDEWSALLKELSNTNQVQEVRLDGQKHLVVSSTSSDTGWTTVGIIPEHALLKGALDLRRQIAQLVLLVAIAVLLVSIGVTSRITKNLRRLRNMMNRVQEDNFAIGAPIASEDEVGQLYRVFADMLGRLKQSMDDIKHREGLKREAELTALQAQIRPHFMYNSLNTIKYMAGMNNAKNIEEVAGSLIELLRGVLGNTREFIPLREELQVVQSYLNIQKYKYADRFAVHYQVEPELLDLEVLKLTVQPLVENAVTHGVGAIREQGFITVKVYRENRTVKIEVSDNGIGMLPEQIERALRTDSLHEPYRRGGLGIRNVNERIKLVYGSEYGVRLFSRPDAFTKAEITIPFPQEAIPVAQSAARR